MRLKEANKRKFQRRLLPAPVEKFLLGSEQIRFDELHHAVILDEVVLKRGTSEGDPPFGLDGGYDFGNGRRLVFQKMTLVAHDQIGALKRESR